MRFAILWILGAYSGHQLGAIGLWRGLSVELLVMVIRGVEFPEQKIAEFCARHGVSRLSLFGSILRDDFRPDSDVDMLVEFLPGRTPGVIGFGGMILELSAIVGRTVDLRTPFDLSRHFLPLVMKEARLLHAA